MRKWTGWLILFCFVWGMTGSMQTPVAHACSCAKPSSVEEEFARSTDVFAGRVIKVKEESSIRGSVSGHAILFEVERIYKGDGASQKIIYTGIGGGDCGYPFEEGEDYLVYAYPSSMYSNIKRLTTIICDRTTVVDQADADFVQLGEGIPPNEQVDLSAKFNRTNWIFGLAIGGIVFIVFSVIVWYVRTKKRGSR